MMVRTLTSSLMLLFACVGCSSQFVHKLSFDPREPLRVAVLPFIERDSDGNIVDSSPNLYLKENQALENDESENYPALILQKLVQSEIAGSTYLDVVPPGLVRAELVHRNFVNGNSYNHPLIASTSAKEFCKFLECDAILRGTASAWSQRYYGLQTVSSLEFKISMIRAVDEKEIFFSKARDYVSQGLLKGPTGYISLVLEPLKGLDGDIIQDLARKVVVKALNPLSRRGKKELPADAGMLPAIYAIASDFEGGQLKDSITVMMFGSSGQSAYFSIGNAITGIPMIELNAGHYLGVYYPLKTDRFTKQSISATLTDKYGRSASKAVGNFKVSYP